jgi:hypothetical protein
MEGEKKVRAFAPLIVRGRVRFTPEPGHDESAFVGDARKRMQRTRALQKRRGPRRCCGETTESRWCCGRC